MVKAIYQAAATLKFKLDNMMLALKFCSLSV